MKKTRAVCFIYSIIKYARRAANSKNRNRILSILYDHHIWNEKGVNIKCREARNKNLKRNSSYL